jgi:hypothetical protein
MEPTLWPGRGVAEHAYCPRLFYYRRSRVETVLRETVNLKVDQVLIMDLGRNEEAARESATVLGPAMPVQESGVVVI